VGAEDAECGTRMQKGCYGIVAEVQFDNTCIFKNATQRLRCHFADTAAPQGYLFVFALIVQIRAKLQGENEVSCASLQNRRSKFTLSFELIDCSQALSLHHAPNISSSARCVKHCSKSSIGRRCCCCCCCC
jgi:hypothetical protein